MKPIKGPAHPINVPCRRCKVPAGEDCHVIVCGLRCPERERDNHKRLAELAARVKKKDIPVLAAHLRPVAVGTYVCRRLWRGHEPFCAIELLVVEHCLKRRRRYQLLAEGPTWDAAWNSFVAQYTLDVKDRRVEDRAE